MTCDLNATFSCDAHWPMLYISNLRAAGLLLYRRGTLLWLGDSQRLLLIIQDGRLVDVRAGPADEEIFEGVEVIFPRHIARVGVTLVESGSDAVQVAQPEEKREGCRHDFGLWWIAITSPQSDGLPPPLCFRCQSPRISIPHFHLCLALALHCILT